MKKILFLLLLIGFSTVSYSQDKTEEDLVEPAPPPPKLIVKFSISQLLEPKANNYEFSLEHVVGKEFSLQHSVAYVRDDFLDNQRSNLACRCQGYKIGTGVHWYFKGIDRIDSGYLGLMARFEQYFGRKEVIINHGEGTFFQHDEFSFRQNIIGGYFEAGTLSYLSKNWAIDAGIALGSRYFDNQYEENLPAGVTYELVDDNKAEIFYTDEPGKYTKLSFLLMFKIAYTIK